MFSFMGLEENMFSFVWSLISSKCLTHVSCSKRVRFWMKARFLYAKLLASILIRTLTILKVMRINASTTNIQEQLAIYRKCIEYKCKLSCIINDLLIMIILLALSIVDVSNFVLIIVMYEALTFLLHSDNAAS